MSVAEKKLRTDGLPVIAFEPWRHGVLPRIHEVWFHRRFMRHASIQFILKRYRQTYLGWLWIFLRPGFQIITTTLFFGGILAQEYGDRPAMIYIGFSMAGWIMFERSFHWGMRSVRMTRALARKLHLPRSLTSASAAAPALVDFTIYIAVAVGAVIYYLFRDDTLYLAPPAQWVFAVAGVALLLAFGLAIGLFTGPLMMITKEVRYIQMYVLQLWMFLSPVVYDVDHIPNGYRTIVEVNPLTAPLGLVQWGFLSTSPPAPISFVSTVIALTVLVVGGFLFSSRFERAAVARL